jgi:16S rRNA (cytidine1402-2'-O)-methyltransferase
MPGHLYLVATPIGNLEDITYRAVRMLGEVDLIACEDTRQSRKLLDHYGIQKPTISYHDHNETERTEDLAARMLAGTTIALVSDAGTPLVSDPGFKLVREAIAERLPVTTLPGPSAALAALVLSGLPSDRFLFAGFLPPKAAARRRALTELAAVPATLVFFEGVSRLADALGDMAATLGDRPAVVAREITKLYEEVRRGALRELGAHYAAAGPPRGEVVVVVGPPPTDAPALSEDALDAQLQAALTSMSLKDASAAVAAATGLKRRDVYARALALAGRGK